MSSNDPRLTAMLARMPDWLDCGVDRLTIRADWTEDPGVEDIGARAELCTERVAWMLDGVEYWWVAPKGGSAGGLMPSEDVPEAVRDAVVECVRQRKHALEDALQDIEAAEWSIEDCLREASCNR